MSDFKDTVSGLEQLETWLEIIDKNEIVNSERALCVLTRNLTNINNRELREEAGELDHLATELSNIGRKEYSFLKIFGIEKYEFAHSSFLAWILDPLESHGLGSQFARIFLEKAARKVENMNLSGIDLSSLLVRTEVSTEASRLDIRLMDPSGRFICVIENKILSKEGDKQTKRLYKDNHAVGCPKELFIFLTLSGREKPEDEHFLSLTYAEVLPGLRQMLSLSSDDTKHLIKNYVNTLEGLIMSEEFDQYSERTQLYYRFSKQINEVKKAFDEDRGRLLSALEEGITNRKWWDDKWGIWKTGSEVMVWKDNWYRDEDEEEGPFFQVKPDTAQPIIHVSLLGYPSPFAQKFAPILEKNLEQKYPGKIPCDFKKTLTGVLTFLDKRLLFSLTEKDIVQKTLACLDELIDHFGETVERSVKEFRKKQRAPSKSQQA